MIGKHIHNYQVTARLGEGGMGIVYKATDTVLGRDVALKMLHAQLIKQTQFLERFRKEARVLAQLLHPNIAVIYNFIEQDDNYFMVMEYVEGMNLDELLRQHQQLNHETVVASFIQALEGLHQAHKKGIYHRDIKPANLILTPDGTVKLMDFGIAKMAGEQRLTQVNRVVGTIEFMAPELIEGKDPSVASDIYAAGVTMYELLTGKLPFEGNTDYNLMQDILKKKPLSIEKLNAAVPRSLSNIVMQALEKNPANRFQNAKAFQQALTQAFPALREIEIGKIAAIKKPSPATQIITSVSQSAGQLQATQVIDKYTNPSNKVYNRLAALKEKIADNKPAAIVAGALLLIVIVMLVIGLSPDSPDQTQLIAGTDTPGEKKPDSTVITGGTDPVTPAVYTADPRQKREEPPAVLPSDVNQPKEKDKKKEDPKKEKDPAKEKQPVTSNLPADQKKEEPVVIVPVKKTEEIVVPDPPKRRAVAINTKMEVNLYLNQAIDPGTAQEGQSLSFSVSSPVIYNGDIIIEKGASASGRIKNLSNKKMSIVINSVNGVNGQRLYFQEVELSGRISEILSSRNYSATLKKGITINL